MSESKRTGQTGGQGSLLSLVRRTRDGRVVCVTCGCVAVSTNSGRWICGGRCPN